MIPKIRGGGGGFYEMGSKKIRGAEKLREVIESNPRLQALLKQRVESYLQELSIDEEEDDDDDGE